MSDATNEQRTETRNYLIGYGLALLLTAASFAAVYWQAADAKIILTLVFVLALVQIIIHFRFFLQVNTKPHARDNLLLIVFSTLIIALMVAGTLVLLFNLRLRMM